MQLPGGIGGPDGSKVERAMSITSGHPAANPQMPVFCGSDVITIKQRRGWKSGSDGAGMELGCGKLFGVGIFDGRAAIIDSELGEPPGVDLQPAREVVPVT